MPSFIEDCEGVIADAPSRSGNGPGEPGTGFPRTARLLKHADFERVYKQGRRHFSPHMTVFYLVQATDASQEKRARVGFTVEIGRASCRERV